MARGQAGKADTQLGITNTAAKGYAGTAAGELGPLTAGAETLVNSSGYDPATLGAITNAGIGGVNAAYGDAGGQIRRTAAASKNPADINSSLDALALNKGIAGGQEAGNIQMGNAAFKARQNLEGLNLMSSLYGTNVGASNQLYGMGPSTLGARAAGGGWAQGFGDVLGALVPKVNVNSGGGGGG